MQSSASSSAPHSPVHRPADWMFFQPALMDLLHDAVITTDLEGIITGFNQAAQRIYGYLPADLTGKSVSIFYSEEEQHTLHDVVLPTVKAGGQFQGEVRNRTKTGDYIYVHLAVALLRDTDGEPVGLVGISVDVTSQKLGQLSAIRQSALEKELEARTEAAGFLRTLKRAVDKSTDAVLVTEAEPYEGPGPRIVYVNAAFEQMTGYLAEEILGETPRILQGPKSDREVLGRIRNAIRLRQPIAEEMINYRKDGSEFHVEMSIVPVTDDKGCLTHLVSIQRDTSEQHRLRRHLDQRRSEIHRLLNSLPQLVWTADETGRRDWVSDSFARLVGTETKDCLGDGWIRYVHPDDRDLALTKLQNDRKLGRMSQSELRLMRPDGEYIWFLKQAIPTLDKTGRVTRWTGTFTDISERKRAETALTLSEERARLGIAVARLGLAEIDYATGLSQLSAGAAAMFGLGRQEISVPREVVHQTFHPGDLPELMRRIAACLDPNGAGWFEMDHRVVWPGGEVRWLRVRKQVFFEGEGAHRRPRNAMLAALDVADEKLAEVGVRESEKRFRDLAESLPQFVWVTDSKGVKTYCNQRYLDYTGIPTCSLMNMGWQSCVHPDDRAAAAEAWLTALRTETPYLQEYRLRRYDGEYRYFLARAIPVRDEAGEIDRWLGSSTDVHERKMTEEALRRAEKLSVAGRLASSISHEINNPLAGVVNLLYLMQSKPDLDLSTRELLTSAQQQLERVTEATKQSLLFYRESMQPSGLQVAALLDSLVALHRPVIELKSINVMREYRPTQELLCMAGEVRQALAHLLSNALEALSVRGQLLIRLRESENFGESGQRGLVVTIADSGRGIAPHHLPFIFDAFYTTKGIYGTGLGLWIAKDIVTRHGGAIQVKSTVRPSSSGSVFRVFFPYR